MARVLTDKEFADFIHDWVDAKKDEMVKDLLGLLAIPSVGTDAFGDKPFGVEVDRAFDYVLGKGESFGLKCKNVDGYAIHTEWGSGKEIVMSLTHVDVVPIGSGWTMNPLGRVENGKIYGRGAQDNKGPTIASLYALRALKESGVPLKRRVRHVVGGNEESGFRCVRHYFQVEEKPVYGFSPDAYFPLVYAEKGSMNITVEALLDGTDQTNGNGVTNDAEERCHVLDFYGGERANIVPDLARAVLAVPCGKEDDLIRDLTKESKEVFKKVGGPGPLSFDFAKKEGKVEVTAKGKACHASTPWEGTNAIAALLYLVAMPSIGLRGRENVEFLARASDIYGKGLCIEEEDEVTGKLSCNLGVFRYSKEGSTSLISGIYNIRFPVKANVEDLKTRALGCPRPNGTTVTVTSAGTAHYTDPDSFLVKTLLKVYRDETGDDSPPITIGGGTYAKVIPGGVAYGPVRPGQPETAHQADEYLSLEDLFLMTRIYARAFYALAV